MRWLRISVLAVLTAGFVLTVVTGWSYGAHQVAQTGYGAPQVLGDTFIKPKSAGGSHLGLWIGIALALAILGGSGFFGWKHSHEAP